MARVWDDVRGEYVEVSDPAVPPKGDPFAFDDYKPVEPVGESPWAKAREQGAIKPPDAPYSQLTGAALAGPSMSAVQAKVTVAETARQPRVTEESIRAKIADVQYIVHETMTICIITMRSGFKQLGQAAPAAPENFNAEVGKRYAYDDAFRQLWRLEGYLLCEHLLCEQLMPRPVPSLPPEVKTRTGSFGPITAGDLNL